MKNLPVKMADSFWGKIKNWFVSRFNKRNLDKDSSGEVTIQNNNNEKQTENFINEFRTNQSQKVSVENIRIAIEKDFNLLNKMSEEQLKALEKYYDELILKEKGGTSLSSINSKEDMRKLLEKKPELLDRFSTKQLILLEEYYDELIRKEKIKIG